MWGCGAPFAPSGAVPPPGSILRALTPQFPANPSSLRGQARFCPQFHSRMSDSTLVGATSCRSAGHTAETREGRAVFIVIFFVSFHPGLGRGRARSQCPRSTSGSLTSPRGRRREAFPRAELGSRHAPSPSATGRARTARWDL